MKEQLLNVYKNTKKIINEEPNKVKITFINGPKVEITGDNEIEYFVQFIDKKTNDLVHDAIIKNNHWTKANRQWYTDWLIRIYNNKTDQLLIQQELNLKNQRVYISFESKSLGDTLAWWPYVRKFKEKHDCHIVVSTFWNKFFKDDNKDIEFVEPGETVTDLVAQYGIGIFEDGYSNIHLNKVDTRKIPLQKVVCELLGLEYKEEKTKIRKHVHPILTEYYDFMIKSNDSNYYQTLNGRIDNFSKLMYLLDLRNKPINILETGSSRISEKWGALYDGGFTLLFSNYLKKRKFGGKLTTINNNKEHLEECKKLTKNNKSVINYVYGNSIDILKLMSDEKIKNMDLFYLDSMDLDFNNPERSAEHHLKELKHIINRLRDDAIIVIDDNWIKDTTINGLILNKDCGKGYLVKQFLFKEGWEQFDIKLGHHVNQYIFQKKRSKYVCIAEHGTAQSKYWNNPNGWQWTVDYLNRQGYKVIAISKEKTKLNGVIDNTGDISIEKRISMLQHADFFIGISSGMSWLAWAVGIPVIMISGHTKSWYEFSCNRVHNDNVCNGCWHNHQFDKGNWNWCPENKDFECTKMIGSDDVIQEINALTGGEHFNIKEQRKWNEDEMWKDDGEQWSTSFGNTDKLWLKTIHPQIYNYLKGNVLEIAPGYGRITQYLLGEEIDSLDLVDLNENCIEKCKEKFKDIDKQINYYVNDGMTLDVLGDKKYDFIISWDSFVHMHKDIVKLYIKEISKKLKDDGVAYIHHSNLSSGKELSFFNVAGRSNMSTKLFDNFLKNNGLKLITRYEFLFGKDSYANDRNVNDTISIFKLTDDNVDINYMFYVNNKETPIDIVESNKGFSWNNWKEYQPYNLMFHEIFNDNCYFYSNCRVEKDDIVLDVGANIGIFERYAKILGAKKVYCFEPEPGNFECLKKNVANNTVCENIIIDEYIGYSTLYLDDTSGGHSVINNNINNTKTGETFAVECITINKIIEKYNIDKIDFMKVDVEGAELKVFSGVSDDNLKKINKIAMEYHDMIFDFNNDIKQQFVNRLKHSGFNSWIQTITTHLTLMYFWR